MKKNKIKPKKKQKAKPAVEQPQEQQAVAQKPRAYDATNIQVLEGIEAVRMRPESALELARNRRNRTTRA